MCGGSGRICAVPSPAEQSPWPPHHPRGHSGAGSSACPCPHAPGKKQELKKTLSCLPCASAQPREPVPGHGSLRENKRWRRKTGTAGCGGASRAPASPSHPPRLAHAEAKPKAAAAAGPSPGSAGASLLAGKVEEGKENSEPVSPPQKTSAPWSGWESSCAESTRPSPHIARTRLCPGQPGSLLGEPRLTPLKIHGVFLLLLLTDPPSEGRDGLRHKRQQKDEKKSPHHFQMPLWCPSQAYAYIPVSGFV